MTERTRKSLSKVVDLADVFHGPEASSESSPDHPSPQPASVVSPSAIQPSAPVPAAEMQEVATPPAAAKRKRKPGRPKSKYTEQIHQKALPEDKAWMMAERDRLDHPEGLGRLLNKMIECYIEHHPGCVTRDEVDPDDFLS